MGSFNQETLDALKQAQSQSSEDIAKNFVSPTSATTGLQAYNLEPSARLMTPIDTPLRNSIERVGGGFATQANWKYIDGINVQNVRPGVSQGNRGGIIQHSLKEKLAAFRGYGLENSVTFEAQYAGKNFEDLKALAVMQTLQATFVEEERLILGGNTSLSMGVTPTPTLATAAGGTLAAATYSVICVALGNQAWLDVCGVNNGSIGQYFNAATAVIPAQITRTNADGTSDTFGAGSAQKSAAATIAVSANGLVTASVAAVKGAVGYAWFIGAAGSERLVAVSSINSVSIKDAADGAAQLASSLPSVDSSTSSLEFDGLLTMAADSAAYRKVMATGVAGVGTSLTSDGANGIVEFEEAFYHFYTKYRLSPDAILVSAQELRTIVKLIVGNGGASLLRLNVSADSIANIQGGAVVGSYLNKVTGKNVQLIVHPNMPAGTLMFWTKSLPYPQAGVSNTARMVMRQDYYQIEWPLKSRKYEYGVYADGVLQHYAPFAMGTITNIAG